MAWIKLHDKCLWRKTWTHASHVNLDAHVNWIQGAVLPVVKWEFLRRHANANRLVFGVQNLIHTREYDQAYHAFLVEKVIERGINKDSAPDYVTENFFDDNLKINFRGVNFMLKEIGILK